MITTILLILIIVTISGLLMFSDFLRVKKINVKSIYKDPKLIIHLVKNWNKRRKETKKKRKEWNFIWEQVKNDYHFKSFYQDEYNDGKYIFGLTFEKKVVMKHRGDFTIFRNYHRWQKNKEKEEKAIKMLANLPNKILSDFNSNPKSSKLQQLRSVIIYTFENGDKVTFYIHSNELIYKTDSFHYSYKLGVFRAINYVDCFNHIIRRCNDKYYQSSRNSHYRSSRESRERKSTVNDPKKSHPKYNRFWTLVLNIRERRRQLDNMSKNDPNRSMLINELNTAVRQAKKMKKKYDF